jgi:zinc protease
MKLGLMVFWAVCVTAFTSSAWAASDLPQSWTTPKGLKVIFKAAPGLPMVDLRLVFDAGSARDGQAFGLASMTSAQFALASTSRSEQAVAEGFEQVGARFSTSSFKDMAVVQLRSLTRETLLSQSMELMTDLLAHPAFDAQIFEREKKRLIVDLQEVKHQPNTLASQAFSRLLYGSHPYAHPVDGTETSVQAIQVSDLRDFYKNHYVAQNGVLAMVGALSLEQAKALAAQIDNALTMGEKAPAIPAPKAMMQAKQEWIEFPSNQTQLFIGQLGMKRGDADYFPLYLANHILGGSGFGSRLMQEVREKRGLTYSVYSYFSPMRERGPFLMSTQTRNDRADESQKVMLDTLARFVAQGPTEQELQASKDNVLGGFALKIDSNKEQVEYWAMIGFYDLPLTYLHDFQNQIRRVSVSDIRKALARRIQTDRLVSVRLGPKNVPQKSVTPGQGMKMPQTGARHF